MGATGRGVFGTTVPTGMFCYVDMSPAFLANYFVHNSWVTNSPLFAEFIVAAILYAGTTW